MQINGLRYVLTVVAAFVAYGLIYTGAFAVMDVGDLMAEYGRSDDDPLAAYAMIGHLLETLVLVFIYFRWVRSNAVGTGALYGTLIGLYYAATQLSTMGGFKGFTPDLVFGFLPLHVIAGLIAGGLVPAVLYKAPKATPVPTE